MRERPRVGVRTRAEAQVGERPKPGVTIMPDLRDRIIAITRSDEDALEFSQLVNQEGGRVVAIPAIQIVPADAKVAGRFIDLMERKRHDYCAFMSAQAVKVLFGLAGEKVVDVLARTSVIAVGPKTKQELERHGIRVDLVPERFSSIGLVELMSGKEPRGKNMIIPRSGEANDYATKALSDLGMEVDEVFLYSARTADVTQTWQEFVNLLTQKKIDAIVFTSASNVRSFFEIMGRMHAELHKDVDMISIGPFTTAELARKGIACHEAKDHTIKGTFELVRKLCTSQKR